MAIWRKFVTVSFTALSLFAVSVTYSLKPASAGEPLFDKNCRNYPRTTEKFKSPAANEATYVFKTLDFITNRKKYFLSVIRDNNGAAFFCIYSSKIMQMERLINAEKVQGKYIYQIVKEHENNPEFLITLREGNGRTARTTVYKLNLKNPNQPVLALVNHR